MRDTVDCLVVGGGPAGLTAAIYLARFRLDVLLVDGGASRAMLIPRTHNHAGFPKGIVGADLLARMNEQVLLYGASVEKGRVSSLLRDDGAFRADLGGRSVQASTVLLATGITNRRPICRLRWIRGHRSARGRDRNGRSGC